MSARFQELFPQSDRSRVLVGVVHLLPTPGAPFHAGHAGHAGSLEAVLTRARADARALVQGGADAVLVENLGDAPFFAEHVPPETIAAMAVVLHELRPLAAPRPLGVNVLRNDARAALGLCAAGAASFLRVNVHTGVMASDQGLITGRAAETLRERTRLAPGALILADVHVKHATPLGAETLADAADDAWRRGRADALILTGPRTGAPPARRELEIVRERLDGAVLLVGSGLCAENAQELLALAQGAIVGTALKHGGRIEEPVDERRMARLRAACDALG
jgi:hypothetical protein